MSAREDVTAATPCDPITGQQRLSYPDRVCGTCGNKVWGPCERCLDQQRRDRDQYGLWGGR